MTVESATYVTQLDATYPRGSDVRSEGDNHLRLIKTALSNSFPNVNGPLNASMVSYSATGSGVTSANVHTKLEEFVSVKDFGALGNGVDDTLAIQSAIDHVVSSTYRKILYFPAGDYVVTSTITIDQSSNSGVSTSHRNLIFMGEGGMTSELGTVIRLNVANASNNGLEITSCLGVRIENIAFTSTGATNNVVIINSGVSPNLSGSLITFRNCYFKAADTTPTEAVVQAVNNKNVVFDSCWFGVNAATDTAIRLGGNVADNGSYLQQGELDGIHILNCFIYGVVMVRKIRNFIISGNTFVEAHGSCINVEGDKDLHGGIIQSNYFAENALDANAATGITLGDYASVGGEDAGCVTISGNRFRRRPKGILVQGKGPYVIENNHFRPDTNADIGIEIAATAEQVQIGPNDFKDMYANDALCIDDKRYTAWTDEPTENLSSDIVADFVLTADDANISGVTTTILVGSVTGVNLRGGKYRVRMQVIVRNTDATDDLPFQAWLKYRDQNNNLREIGVAANGVTLNTGKFDASAAAISMVYVERIVYLGGTTNEDDPQSAFELYVKNRGAGTPATGYVVGDTTEVAGAYRTWFQVEEYRD